MMCLDMPATPLANGMWMCSYDLVKPAGLNKPPDSSCSSHSNHLVRQEHHTSAPTKLAAASSLASSAATAMQQKEAVVSSNHRTKKDPGAPYQSVDPRTGRVWGAPNCGGRGQCYDCSNRAMTTNKRCESC